MRETFRTGDARMDFIFIELRPGLSRGQDPVLGGSVFSTATMYPVISVLRNGTVARTPGMARARRGSGIK